MERGVAPIAGGSVPRIPRPATSAVPYAQAAAAMAQTLRVMGAIGRLTVTPEGRQMPLHVSGESGGPPGALTATKCPCVHV